MKKTQQLFAQAEVHAGAWKLAPNEVWNVPAKPVSEVRFDIETTGSGWNVITSIAGLAIEPDGKVWGWRKLQKPKESRYVHEGFVSVGGEKLRAFTSSLLFERSDGSLCDVGVLYVCRKKDTYQAMSAQKEALPVGQRPKCRACGKELKPNYDSEKVGSHVERKYKKWVDAGLYDRRRTVREVQPDDYGAKQAEDGRWYIEHVVEEKALVFRGTYGRYADDLFCGLNCAYRWAVGVCIELEKEGEHWTTYKKKGK